MSLVLQGLAEQPFSFSLGERAAYTGASGLSTSMA